MFDRRSSSRVSRAVALSLLAAVFSGAANAATTEELEARLQALATQMQALQSELAQLKAQQNAATANASTAASVASNAQPTSAAESRAGVGNQNPLTWFGYGEMNYSRPKDDSATSADVARFVIGTGYRFDERTRFVSELEVEHAIASADDSGEVEVEQAFVERQFGDSMYSRFGLFLVPSGLLNESHEPTRYYGVFRNFVETAIIPTTWRELGVEIEGNTQGGLRWDVGVATGFDLSKWDAAATEGIESPLASIHQEGQLAHAKNLSGIVAVNYTGLPGLRVGASIAGGDISQGQPGFDNNTLTLWETHARWTPGAWDLSALYAHGHISNTAPVNLTFLGNPTLIPEDFYGWYAQAAYNATLPNTWTLSPFARFERLNTASSYAFLGTGITPEALRAEDVKTVGLNLNITEGVVFKADYQWFHRDTANDRFDLGLGYAF